MPSMCLLLCICMTAPADAKVPGLLRDTHLRHALSLMQAGLQAGLLLRRGRLLLSELGQGSGGLICFGLPLSDLCKTSWQSQGPGTTQCCDD